MRKSNQKYENFATGQQKCMSKIQSLCAGEILKKAPLKYIKNEPRTSMLCGSLD